MNTDPSKTTFLSVEALEAQKRGHVPASLPFPLSLMFKELLIKEEMGHEISPFQILYFASSLIKYTACITMADWCRYLDDKNLRVSEVNSSILKYLKTGCMQDAIRMIEIITQQMVKQNVPIFLRKLPEILKPCFTEVKTPSFFDPESTLINAFNCFVNFQKELTHGIYSLNNPPQKIVNDYFRIAEHLACNIGKIFEHSPIIPFPGKNFNCYTTLGTIIRANNIRFDSQNVFVNKYKTKAVLYKSADHYLNLYPFVIAAGLDSGAGRDINLLFAVRASVDGCHYMDLWESREFITDTLTDKNLETAFGEILRKLQIDVPREKKEMLSPVLSFDDLIAYHKERFIPREIVSDKLHNFIKKAGGKYAVLYGLRGCGKTTLLCSLLFNMKEHPFIYHFARRINNHDKPQVVLRSLIGQLLKIRGTFEMDWGIVPYDIPSLINLFKDKLFETAAYCKKNNEKLVFIFDALDDLTFEDDSIPIIPQFLPENVVGIMSRRLFSDGGMSEIPYPDEYLQNLEQFHLESFSLSEISSLLESRELLSDNKEEAENFSNKFYWASLKGDPLLAGLLSDCILADRIKKESIISLDKKLIEQEDWKAKILEDDHYRVNIFNKMLNPDGGEFDPSCNLIPFIAGLINTAYHPLSCHQSAQIIRTDAVKILPLMRQLNPYLTRERDGVYYSNLEFADHFNKYLTKNDKIDLTRKLIEFYGVKLRKDSIRNLDFKSLSAEALSFLPEHFYRLGMLTEDYSGLYELAGNDQFRLEQGLRHNVHEILDTLHLAVNASIEQNDIPNLIKFGFLYDDIKSGGIKGGLSLIISQAVEGSLNEALKMVRKIPDESFKYRLLLFLVWLTSKNGDFLNAIEILDEALVLSEASFDVEDEDFILTLVEGIIGNGIAEGLDVLETGASESKVVEYYSRLADLLTGHPELIQKIATGASMQLRKISDEKLKSQYILEFAGIVSRLNDEIKKMQFLENFIYEACNIEDERIQCETRAKLAQILAEVDGARAEEILRSIIEDLEEMGSSALRFSLEALTAGKIAQLGREEWACELFSNIIEKSSQLYVPMDKAEVLQEAARSTVFLADSSLRADFLEKIFSSAETLDDITLQAKVMIGISEVLSPSDEELLNIYLETFRYIDELPVDMAVNAISRIAGNMKIVREMEWFEQIMTIIANLMEYLKTPEEKAKVFIPVAQGLCAVTGMPADTQLEYIKGLLDLIFTSFGKENGKTLGKILGNTAASILDEKLKGAEELISLIVQKTRELENEEVVSIVYGYIGEKLHLVESPTESAKVYEYLESSVRDIKTTRFQVSILTGIIRGIINIKNRSLRDVFVQKIIYLIESLEEKKQAYKLLSFISAGLIKAGEEEKGIELYKKALSLIPLKEEKAPDALGGVMAGLCRGIASFASKKWAREIYDKLLNRLDFIAPEKKKLEVFLGITDGLKALEDKKLLKDYYTKLMALVENFYNRREKVIGFLRLANSFQEIDDKANSRKMWEHCITAALYLDDEENGKLKTTVICQALLSIWNLEDQEWAEQASGMIFEKIKSLPVNLLTSLIEEVFYNIENLPNGEMQAQILEKFAQVIDSIKNYDHRILCISALSRGIKNLNKGPLLQRILDRMAKDIGKVKEGTYRARSMAIIAANFLNVGIRNWAMQAYNNINKAYGKLKDSQKKAVMLGEMAKIPFASDEEKWQAEMVDMVLEKELSSYQGVEKSRILQSLAGVLPHSENKEWAAQKIQFVLKEAEKLSDQCIDEVYEALYKGFEENNDIEAILKLRNSSAYKNAKEISTKYLKETLKRSAKDNIKDTLKYFDQIKERNIKTDILKYLFQQLMENQKVFSSEEFRRYRKSLLELSIYDRDSLDYVIGKTVSYFEKKESLLEIAEILGLAERKEKKPEAGLITPAETEVPSSAEQEVFNEPLDLLSESEQSKAPAGTHPPRRKTFRKGFLHKRTTAVSDKTQMKQDALPDSIDINDLLKDGNRMVKSNYFSEAIRFFEKAISSFPNDPRGYVGMAVVHYMLRDYKISARYYSQAIDADSSEDQLERFLKMIPKNAYLWYDFARQLYNFKKYNDASKLCEKIKAEGVYFDFVKKVDELIRLCSEKAKTEEKKDYSKIYMAAAAVLFLLFMPSFLSWFHCSRGNSSMKEGYELIQKYSEGSIMGNKSEYEFYTEPFKKALNSFEKCKKSIAFSHRMQQEVELKKGICKYEIGHFLINNEKWKLSGTLHQTEIKDALKYRNQAVSRLERLTEENPDMSKALFYLGLCHLDNAMDPDIIKLETRVNTAEAFTRAVRNLQSSLLFAERDNTAGYENYLMLGMAKIEAYMSFRDAADPKWIQQAIRELEKGALIKQDPRIYVYLCAAYRLNRDRSSAELNAQKAQLEIDSAYAGMLKRRKYWHNKLQEVSNL